jgi:hypothetical protein
MLIVTIQEPSGDYAIVALLNVDGPAMPGAVKGNPASLKRREGVRRSRSGHSLAERNGPGPCPVIPHKRIRTSAHVVRRAQSANGLRDSE